MKILMVGPFPPPVNGMSLANRMLVSGLESRAHVVDTIDTKTGMRRDDVKNQGRLSFGKVFRSITPVTRGVWRILLTKKYEVLYLTPSQNANGYLKYVPIMWAARIRKIPYFIHIHGGYFRTMYDGLRGWKKRAVDNSLNGLAGAIVLGPSLRFMFEGLVPDEKIFVCENGIEDEIFATEEEIKQKIERYKIEDAIRIVYLSNLLESKGILDLLEAIRILRSRGKKIHLDAAGAIEPAIEDRVKVYLNDLGDSVTYHGLVQGMKKKELLLNNHIFCLPTYYPNEGQPISILEAMANGCVVVTTDHGGIKDIVNEEYGVFVEKQNPEAVSKALSGSSLKDNVMLISWQQANTKYHVSKFVARIEDILILAESRN